METKTRNGTPKKNMLSRTRTERKETNAGWGVGNAGGFLRDHPLFIGFHGMCLFCFVFFFANGFL